MRRSCRSAVATVAVSALALAVPASAAAAVTITLPARADLAAKILVTVPVTVTCGPYEQTLDSTSVSVAIEQATSKGIAHGSAFRGGFMDPTFALTCDGSAHVYPIAVTADPAGPPFKSGSAIISGTAGAFFDCCTGETASAGPQPIKLN
jgi:hypothetical protein